MLEINKLESNTERFYKFLYIYSDQKKVHNVDIFHYILAFCIRSLRSLLEIGSLIKVMLCGWIDSNTIRN